MQISISPSFTKRALIITVIMLSIALFIGGCSGDDADPTPLPAPTALPTLTPLPPPTDLPAPTEEATEVVQADGRVWLYSATGYFNTSEWVVNFYGAKIGAPCAYFAEYVAAYEYVVPAQIEAAFNTVMEGDMRFLYDTTNPTAPHFAFYLEEAQENCPDIELE